MAATATTEKKSELRFGKGGWLHKTSEYDVVFEFPHHGGEQLYANSFVLRAASPLFEDLFGSGATSNAAAQTSLLHAASPLFEELFGSGAAGDGAVAKGPPTVFRVDNRTPQQMDSSSPSCTLRLQNRRLPSHRSHWCAPPRDARGACM
jgi:hypothetical protein